MISGPEILYQTGAHYGYKTTRPGWPSLDSTRPKIERGAGGGGGREINPFTDVVIFKFST